jgi:hypothetical protein
MAVAPRLDKGTSRKRLTPPRPRPCPSAPKHWWAARARPGAGRRGRRLRAGAHASRRRRRHQCAAPARSPACRCGAAPRSSRRRLPPSTARSRPTCGACRRRSDGSAWGPTTSRRARAGGRAGSGAQAGSRARPRLPPLQQRCLTRTPHGPPPPPATVPSPAPANQGSTGYGHGDMGREALDAVMAEVMGAEAALVRIQFMSGTHAIAAALYAVLRPGDEMLAVAGK